MSRKKARIRYELDSGDISHLSDVEIAVILRAADMLIAAGGRNLLVKILKGSKDCKVLEHGLDHCPVYGYYRELTLTEITKRVDWMIEKDYLSIEYQGRLPMLVFSDKGWQIERETMADELLQLLKVAIGGADYRIVEQLKDRNREMILLLIEKIILTGDVGFIPLLKAWQAIEYKKVQSAIQSAMNHLMQS